MDTIHPSLILSIFSINGAQHDFFNCTREVRQGDPLSPILFFLVEEILIRSIAKLVLHDSLKLIKSRKNTYIPSHVIYVDEILISFKGEDIQHSGLRQSFQQVFPCIRLDSKHN